MPKPWKNPVSHLTRKFSKRNFETNVLQCKQCGSCCPPDCHQFERREGKAFCKIHNELADLKCELPPESIFQKLAFKNRGKFCKACQELVDLVFGKGKYDLSFFSKFDERNFPPGLSGFSRSVQALIKAGNMQEFESAKNRLAECIAKARIKAK
jgi:hypothetical protein